MLWSGINATRSSMICICKNEGQKIGKQKRKPGRPVDEVYLCNVRLKGGDSTRESGTFTATEEAHTFHQTNLSTERTEVDFFAIGNAVEIGIRLKREQYYKKARREEPEEDSIADRTKDKVWTDEKEQQALTFFKTLTSTAAKNYLRFSVSALRKEGAKAKKLKPGKITAYPREYNSIRARKYGDRKNHTIPYRDRSNNRIGVHRLTNFPNGPTNPAEHRSTLRITSNNRMKPFKRGTISGLAGLAKDRLHKLGSRLDKRIPDLVGMGAAISFASGLTERMEWTEKSSYRATGFEPDC
ncbi:hypothetical protein KY290_003456 [Solanum tuberosum]|uniref:Uncharacterized protein n=1 Tax=Solanum tuberosum TaxID=4113 RepID=A0ABQ7WSY1_SOLTU|nr:hypothetical protein KY284_028716 [Solanum tuberosum]KAH0663804.1 hypothetical protein KY284_028735 [Solanum tuberosum]KAH0664610.1 hypothetical protein KY284_029541 [Solanum tuberosum]KAH0667761.1 hypothetical protein KY285_028967 [Solanum tuberosum]KAH0671027.1 hypothetical protein KY289_025520 [Solanum tuberosum]